MKIGIIIQARMSSTRLPGKVLKYLPYGSNVTVLQQVIRRVKRSKLVDEVIIATTTDKEDNVIVKAARKECVKWFKGSKDDVLSRYFLCAKKNQLDVIIRITSDCPCVDSEIIDRVIAKHIKAKADYTSGVAGKIFSNGMDVEVFNISGLKNAFLNAKDPYDREHVTPYFYRNPNLFKIFRVNLFKAKNATPIRITLDTKEDYCLLCAVYDFLYTKKILDDGSELSDFYDFQNLFFRSTQFSGFMIETVAPGV